MIKDDTLSDTYRAFSIVIYTRSLRKASASLILGFDAKTSFVRGLRPKLVRILVLGSPKPSSSHLIPLTRCRDFSRSGLIRVNPPGDHPLLLRSPHIGF